MNAVFANHNVKVNRQGIDHLKNWTLLEHFDYCDIEYIEIKKGYLLKNRMFVCILGIIIMIFALYFLIRLFSDIEFFSIRPNTKGFWALASAPIFIFIFGLALFLKTIIKENVMHIILQDKSQHTILLPYNKKHLKEIIEILRSNNVKVLDKIILHTANNAVQITP